MTWQTFFLVPVCTVCKDNLRFRKIKKNQRKAFLSERKIAHIADSMQTQRFLSESPGNSCSHMGHTSCSDPRDIPPPQR